jgi:hypothetical protein
MTALLTTLTVLWCACGAAAATQAHRGLKRGCEEECGPGDYPLGGMWVIWGPVLALLVVCGPVSWVAAYLANRSPNPVSCEEDPTDQW